MMNEDVKKVLLTEEQIKQRIKEIANQINNDYEGHTPLFLGIIKGCLPFMNELLMNIHLYCTTDYMRISSFNGGTKSTGKMILLEDICADIVDKDVIIIEDIIDSGKTLEMVTDLLKQKGARSVEIATLLSKPKNRTCDVNVKYIGFNIDDDFVIGFGLDYEEKYRNLPFIGILDFEKIGHC